MNVASATYRGASSLGLMTARGGQSVDGEADTLSASSSERSERSIFHYPVVGFSYDRDTWRVVILYRDPDTGDTTARIPTEAALERYKQSQRIEKADDAKTQSAEKETSGGKGSASSSDGGVVVSLFSSKTVDSGVASSSVSSSDAPAPDGVNTVNVIV